MVEKRLASFPPLVFAGEARELKRTLAEVADGKAFLLQGGDCAESFAEHRRRQYPRLLPRLPADGGGADLCRRAAGGEGRPHRRPVRQAALLADREDRAMSSCRAIAATSSTASNSRRRRAFPIRERQMQAYRQSAATLNLLRAFAQGGYADLEHVHQWMLGFVDGQPAAASATRSSPTGSPRRCDFMRAVRHHVGQHARICARPISIPAMRRCCSATSRR